MLDQDSPQIFISYTKPDLARVIPFFEELEKSGFNIWFDCKRLKPGQNWDFEIKRALEKSSLVIVFLSENSINRRGYVQRELKTALDKLSEKLIDDIYIIPVMLDEGTPIPEQIKDIQCIAANDPNCMSRVQEALTYQLGRLGVETQKLQRKEEISWSYHTKKEAWDGLPGYEVELQFIKLQSDRYPSIDEVGDFIRGELLKSLFSCRNTKLDQLPSIYNYGQEKYRRTDTYDAHCSEPSVKEKVLTIQYAIHWYGAGAAHPNMHFSTYAFVMDPLFLIESLDLIFNEPANALIKIQSYVRNTLKTTPIEGPDEEQQFYLDPAQVDVGTQGWEDFRSFVFNEDGIDFLFDPYHVAGYACGPQFADVPYIELIELIKPEYQSTLGIEYLTYQKARLSEVS